MSNRVPFDSFTKRAKKVLSLAQEEAQRFQHNYIGTEHLLLGLVREGEGVAAHVLTSLGADLNKLRSSVEAIIGRGDRIVLGEIGLTPRAKKVIELAVDEARSMRHHYIGTEHLLLGLVREGEGIAAGVLVSEGIQLEQVRKTTLEFLEAANKGHAQAAEQPDKEAPQTTEDAEQAEITPEEIVFVEDRDEVILPLETESAPVQSNRDRFDKFTERARKALHHAQEEAQRFQHNYIGTEHLLLGLIDEGEGVAIKVLNKMGIAPEKIRGQIEAIIGRGDRIILGEIGLTPRARKAIELAVAEARGMHHHYIGTEHLLLGLVRENEGIAAEVLKSLGATLESTRAATITVLSSLGRVEAGEIEQIIPDEGQQLASDSHQAVLSEDDLTPAPAREESDLPQTFSIRARRALDNAQEEARQLGHNYIGTEHLLLGLTGEENGPAALILQKLGVERARIQRGIKFIISRGPSRIVSGEPGRTPRAQKAVQLAIEEANTFNDALVGTQHLLLGLVREGEGIAAGVLESLGVTAEKVRKEWEKIRFTD